MFAHAFRHNTCFFLPILYTLFYMTMHPTQKALRAIEKFVEKQGYFPSSIELGKALNLSTGMAHRYILSLKMMGLLKSGPSGRIISIVTDIPKDTRWISFAYPVRDVKDHDCHASPEDGCQACCTA